MTRSDSPATRRDEGSPETPLPEGATRDDRLEAIAEVLTMAAEKAIEVSGLGGELHRLMREEALAMQVLGIAMEIRALVEMRARPSTARPAPEGSRATAGDDPVPRRGGSAPS